ncbi:MAG: nucleotidyl transferase AbiEii/AbiGii toxin family protein [Deltaproteobacteria bacterium]
MTAALSPEQEKALATLAPALPADAYLAGGVAVALHLGHRHSRDLDVFTVSSDPGLVVEALASRSDVHVTTHRAGTVYLEVGGVPVSIIRHPYPLLQPAALGSQSTIPIASAADLTAMKLQAIATRGAARDFWDLHGLLGIRRISLAQALSDFGLRYPTADVGHVVRSLVYFGDAAAAPLPAGLDPAHWAEIQRAFEAWVRAL